MPHPLTHALAHATVLHLPAAALAHPMLALLHGGVHRTVLGAVPAAVRAVAAVGERGGCRAERARRSRGDDEFRSLLHLMPPIEVVIAEAPGVVRLTASTR